VGNLKGSPIWKFPKESAPIIQDKLTWIPGNRKLISIWNESILGKTPLNQIIVLQPIKVWMIAYNLETLFDISKWSFSRTG
jgi:hypothetical protein